MTYSKNSKLHLSTELVMTEEIFNNMVNTTFKSDIHVWRMPYVSKETIPLQTRIEADIQDGLFSGNIDEILDWENEVDDTLQYHTISATKDFKSNLFRIKSVETTPGFSGWITGGTIKPVVGVGKIETTIKVTPTI